MAKILEIALYVAVLMVPSAFIIYILGRAFARGGLDEIETRFKRNIKQDEQKEEE